jgi:hypothetical protein
MSGKTISVSILAASAVVGYDLLTSRPNAQISNGDTISSAGLRGSAAAGDTQVRLMAGNAQIGDLFNSDTGFPTGTDMIPVGYTHRGPTVRLYAQVVDAPATNPINLVVNIR